MPSCVRSVNGVWKLTGRQRFRPTLLGKLVLMVEEERSFGTMGPGPPPPRWTGIESRWRDARLDDVLPVIQNAKSEG